MQAVCSMGGAFAVLVATVLSSPTAAQTFEDVHRCDELAAHPDDPGRWATGVYDDAIVPGPAIKFCSEAAATYPDTARFHFQHGRALWAAKQYEQAVEAFLRAEKMDYGPAYAYLGDAYYHGLGGVEKDEDFAVTLYQTAAEAGFEPANTVLADVEALNEDDASEEPAVAVSDEAEPGPAERQAVAGEQARNRTGLPQTIEDLLKTGKSPAASGTDFDPNRFIDGSVLKRLYDGDFERLDSDGSAKLLTVYLLKMNDYFSQTVNFNDPACSAIGDPTLSGTVMRRVTGRLMGGDTVQQGLNILGEIGRMAQNPQGMMMEVIAVENSQKAGATDGARLAELYGCSSAVFKRLYANLVAYVEGGEPVMASGWPGVRLACVKHAVQASEGKTDPRKYCGCMAKKLEAAGLSWEVANWFEANYDHGANFSALIATNEGLRKQVGACLL